MNQLCIVLQLQIYLSIYDTIINKTGTIINKIYAVNSKSDLAKIHWDPQEHFLSESLI